MKITRIVTVDPVTVDVDEKLSVVKSIFEETKFHHLLVIQGNKLTGVISDRDLHKSLSPRIGSHAETLADSYLLEKRAHQIMSRQPITLHESGSVRDAISIFNQHIISCIPVIDDKGRPLGIVSWRDVMKTLEEKLENLKQKDLT